MLGASEETARECGNGVSRTVSLVPGIICTLVPLLQIASKNHRAFSASLRKAGTKATSDSRTISAKSACTSKEGDPCHLRRHSRSHG
jgi:hypothetical protein